MDQAPTAQAAVIDPLLAAVIVDNAIEYAILTLDFDGRIMSWSPGAERILGYSPGEVLGRSFELLFLEADRAAAAPAEELRRAIRDDRAEDTRWHVRKGGEIFWANGMTMRVRGEAVLVKVMRDETATKLAEDQRVLLLNELNHRIKNTLATVQAIVEQTLRGSNVDLATRDSLADRLVALSEAHNVLVDESWAGADLLAIIERTLAPHESHGRGRFALQGPPVRLSPQQAVSMSLVLHELTTNAVKYGALSVNTGQVMITWNIAYNEQGERHLTVLWSESGGPPVTAPQRHGFGSRLIARSFGQAHSGQAELTYAPSGVRCVLTIPLSRPEEIPILAVHGDPSKAAQPRGPSAPRSDRQA